MSPTGCRRTRVLLLIMNRQAGFVSTATANTARARATARRTWFAFLSGLGDKAVSDHHCE
jgi:hypothetical protein